MMALQITTNNHQRDLVSWAELPTEARGQFDYIELTDADGDSWTPRFFRYRNSWYDTQDIPTTRPGSFGGYEELLKLGWEGFASDSFFSGIAIKWGKQWDGTPDYEAVIVGSVYVSDDE